MRFSVIGHPTQAIAASIVREILSYETADGEVYPSATSFKPFLVERQSVLPLHVPKDNNQPIKNN